jgi:hypothetical protein
MSSSNFFLGLGDEMGKLDKDRFQKELAIKYCLVRGLVPFPEVVVPSAADVSDCVEVLTDLDVLGIEFVSDGELRRTLFDCKTTNKMSSINRAFWAAGVMEYTSCHHSYVILKNKAVHNHRMSALLMGVDLHTDESFKDLGKSVDVAFPSDSAYQASIDRWVKVQERYDCNAWSKELFNLNRNVVPLTASPNGVFRRYLAELRQVRGMFDPGKPAHICVFLDSLASLMVLWASLARDARRFYEPTMAKAEFEKALRYYLWGGKESYQMRQQMREKAAADNPALGAVELPSWEKLVAFVGIVLSAPQSIFQCAFFCRELAFRLAAGSLPELDAELAKFSGANSRIRQFSVGLVDYLIAACGLPRDLGKAVQAEVFSH